jgi:hypothetical protein
LWQQRRRTAAPSNDRLSVERGKDGDNNSAGSAIPGLSRVRVYLLKVSC